MVLVVRLQRKDNAKIIFSKIFNKKFHDAVFLSGFKNYAKLAERQPPHRPRLPYRELIFRLVRAAISRTPTAALWGSKMMSRCLS
jgi:hypothetical protein